MDKYISNNANINNDINNDNMDNIDNNSKIELSNITNDEINNINTIVDSFDDLLLFTNEFVNINKLANLFEDLFVLNEKSINISNIDIDTNNEIIFNYIFEEEIERGNIEYKRSLVSYNNDDKTNKLIRQIYWRIYEGVVNIDKECCYYIIGIEDSGLPSFLSISELKESIEFISKSIENSELNYSYLWLKNSIFDYNYLVVKFFPINSNQIDYF